MKKVSRFEALARGLSTITTPIKKEQVANVIEKALLSSKLALVECDAKLEKAAAALVNHPVEENLTIVSDLMQEREDIQKSIEIANSIKKYLNEEVDVDDEKSK